MKQTLHIIAYAAVAIAALTSCAKEEFKENVIPAGEPVEVSISGQIGDFTPADATKATAESVVRVTWGSDDKVYVYDGSNASIGTLTITPDNNNASYAMLSGTITASFASPSKLTLVYVKGATEAPTIAGGKISVDLSSQNQTEVPFVLYTTVAYDADALTKTNEYISFTFATSVMTVNCTGLQTGASGAVAAIDRAEIDGISTACELTIDGSGVAAVAGTTPGTITRTGITGTGASVFQQSDSRGSFRLALAADPTAPTARNILVHQGSKVSGAPFTSTTLAAGKSYNTVYQMKEYATPPAGILPGGFTVNAQGKKVFFTKGNLWYGTAAGESSPAFHFENEQWESSPSADGTRNSAHVSHFYWSRDARVAYAPDYAIAVRTYKVSWTETEVLFTNDPADEEKANGSFTVNGETGKYRSLSKTEWQYLFSYDATEGGTKPSETNYDNEVRRGKYKYGVTVCGKTNCIVILPDVWDTDVISLASFATTTEYSSTTTPTWSTMEAAGAVCLPAAGNEYDDDVWNVGNNGDYASSTTDNKNLSYFVEFGNNPLTFVNGHRDIGISIRLVSESDGYASAEKVSGVIVNKNETTIELGASETLVATIPPANSTKPEVNWSSSDTSVATVDANGKVAGVAVGSAVITATTIDGNFTAVCLVSVEKRSLAGVFTVADDGQGNVKKVHFSKGNLYCKRTSSTTNDWKWNFYENQYQYNSAATTPPTQGSHGESRTATENDTEIDLFTWGYSPVFSFEPVGYSYINGHSATDCETFSKSEDWGYVFSGESSVWRTLTIDEWKYLFNNHSYLWVTVNGVHGYVIAPDGFSGTLAFSYADNAALAADNLVFLPAAGSRNRANVSYVGTDGLYWSSSARNVYNGAYYAYLEGGNPEFDNDYYGRYSGFSVRLVTECQ